MTRQLAGSLLVAALIVVIAIVVVTARLGTTSTAELELREDIDTVLQPGMVVSMEPMVMLPDGVPGAGGYREHDILIVTEDGADNITGFPFGPEHNIIRN